MDGKDFITKTIIGINILFILIGSSFIILPPITLLVSDMFNVISIIVALFFIIIGIMFIYRARTIFKPKSDHIFRSLKKFGDPSTIASEIDKEIKMKKKSNLSQSPLITKSWLIDKSGLTLKIIKLDEIVWIYPKIFKQTINLIPMPSHWSYVIVTKSGKEYEYKCRKKRLPEIIDFLSKKVPSAKIGYE